MTRSRNTALLAVTMTALAPLALAWFLAQATGTVSGRPLDAARVPPGGGPGNNQSAHFAGVSSCSARGCHGALQANPNGTAQNEYSIWAAQDLHGQAFFVLTDERGQRIARNLGIADASKDVRCLACHVTPALAYDVAQHSATHPYAADGVGCEACHGPASVPNASWLTAHTQESWKTADKQRYHMVALGDLKVQATTCVGCHVGAPANAEAGVPARDCNHDIMAAGHPRLTFELASFRENMPPHWRKTPKQNAPAYDAHTWAVGQVATAQGAVDLLRYRAERAQAGGKEAAPWPEFAEADCYSCHAGLRVPSWRREGNVKTRPLGSIPYSDWHTFMLPYVAPGSPQAAAVAEPFQKLRELMNKPYPQPKEVVAACNTLKAPLSALSSLVSGAKYDRDSCRNALARMRTDGTKPSQALSWEEAEQFTLGVAALGRCAELDKEKWQPALNDLWKHDLAFPKGEESPGKYRADKAGFDGRWKKLIDSLPGDAARR